MVSERIRAQMTTDAQAEQRLQRYLADLVTTATPVQRLLMLFDHLRRDLVKASEGFEAKDWKLVSDSLVHAQHIVFALRDPLDRGTELGRSLSSVYDFCLERMVACNLRKDPSMLPPVRALLEQLAEANARAVASMCASETVPASA